MGAGVISKKKKKSGEFGEKTMARWLNELPPEFVVLNNVLLDTTKIVKEYSKKKGRFKSSTQIDHLVVSRYGIFVIETKNHGGHIIGNAMDENWVQAWDNGKMSTFYNPLRQNCKHAEYISRMFNIMPSAIVQAVVFTSTCCDLSMVRNLVYNPPAFVDMVMRKYYRRQVIFTQDEVDYIVQAIKSKRKYGKENEKKHIRFVEKTRRNVSYGC